MPLHRKVKKIFLRFILKNIKINIFNETVHKNHLLSQLIPYRISIHENYQLTFSG